MTENEVRARLQREWVLCAIAAAASRFIPVPLVDDIVKTRATRTAVGRTWAAHGRPSCPEAVGILADDPTGFLSGLVRSAAKLPLQLVLYPVRKAVRLVTAIRGVSADLVGVVLLARSVDRCLTAGWFTSPDPAELERQARVVRTAHEKVIGNADLRVLNHAVAASLRGVGGLPGQALAFARRAFGRDATAGTDDVTAPPPVTTAAEAKVEQGVREVVAVLDRPEIASILADLDRRFDAALAPLTAGPR